MDIYTSKPVKVEAVKLTKDNCKEVQAWCGSTDFAHIPMGDSAVGIRLRHGALARWGEYIAKTYGEQERFKVYSAKEFESAFEV